MEDQMLDKDSTLYCVTSHTFYTAWETAHPLQRSTIAKYLASQIALHIIEQTWLWYQLRIFVTIPKTSLLGGVAQILIYPRLFPYLADVKLFVQPKSQHTLNPHGMAMIVADFLKVRYYIFIITGYNTHWSYIPASIPTPIGKFSSPADLRYREKPCLPWSSNRGSRKREGWSSTSQGCEEPSKLEELREICPDEKFLISCKNKHTDTILEHSASGEDALRGWLVANFAAEMEKSANGSKQAVMNSAYEKMESVFRSFISEMKNRGRHTDRF